MTMQTIEYKGNFIQVHGNEVKVLLINADNSQRLWPARSLRSAKCIITRHVRRLQYQAIRADIIDKVGLI